MLSFIPQRILAFGLEEIGFFGLLGYLVLSLTKHATVLGVPL
jgi:hypothetical protein